MSNNIEPEKAKQIYEKRKVNYERLLKRQKETINFISTLRFIVFTGCIGLSIFLYIRKLYYLSAFVFVIFTVEFILLAIKHNKVINNSKLADSIYEINNASIMRLTGDWKHFKDNGEEFKDVEHSYSDDLDIFGPNSLFQWINTAQTMFGRYSLRDFLAFPILEKEYILKKQEAVKELSKILGFRQKFQAEGNLNFSENRECSDLLKWASNLNNNIESISFKLFSYMLPILTIASSAYYLVNKGKTYFIPLGFVMINFCLIKIKAGLISCNLDTIFIYKKKIKAYANMIKLVENHNFKSVLLKELQERLKTNEKKASEIIKMLSKIADRIADRQNVYSIIFNLIYLRDFHLLAALNKWKRQYGSSVENWLRVIGEVEGLASLSIISHDYPNWAKPVIEESGRIIYGTKAAHPLLSGNAVDNNIRLGGSNSILLITGSNMSGKSTYLRTVGVNLVLAYAGANVRAESFVCSIMDIHTCMRIGDNLEKNISSFYAEIIRIKSIVTAVNTNKPVFFLLDEIFKGTNSFDRHLGAQTLINELSEKNALGIVSTHDLELGNLEETNKYIKNYNFQEYYVNDEIKFDYKIREGVSKTRNAIYLMKLAGINFNNKG